MNLVLCHLWVGVPYGGWWGQDLRNFLPYKNSIYKFNSHKIKITFSSIENNFTRVAWKIEYEDSEKTYYDTRDDKINCVEHCLPSYCYVEGEI